MDRPLTDRERAVLNALLAVDFEDATAVRQQADVVRVVDVCGCGCPSIDFHTAPDVGMNAVVNAEVSGTADTIFLYLLGDRLGGIEYAWVDEAPDELPHPARLRFF